MLHLESESWTSKKYDYVIIGAGFTGLVASYHLAKSGKSVCLIDSDDQVGGLASTFKFNDGTVVEKFYHHWFNNDLYVPALVADLGCDSKIKYLPTKTSMYFNKTVWSLSSPIDLLRFKPLSFINRIRLGLLVFKVRSISNWKSIEGLTSYEWLSSICGKKVFNIVWRPLIESKFSIFADKVNAVWMWKKLVLRGSTRSKGGKEELCYFQGGFGNLSNIIKLKIEEYGGDVLLNTKIDDLTIEGDKVIGAVSGSRVFSGQKFLFTPAFPIIADIFKNSMYHEWLSKLRRVNYLGNMCLVLRLNKSLSDTYWLNVNDPGFPFVGVIEHTNFDTPANYAGSHMVYLSKYLSTSDAVWEYSDEKYFKFAFDALARMFPELDEDSVIDYKVWRAEYAQPVTEVNYSEYIPSAKTPYSNAFISTMAQIYPEDRGTNYAIREGLAIANMLLEE